MCLQPQLLHLWMRLDCKVVVLYYSVQLLEVALVEGDQCLCFQHALVSLNLLTGWKTPQKSSEAVDIAALLKYIANAGHLLLAETVGVVGDHGRGDLVSVHDIPSEGETLHCE